MCMLTDTIYLRNLIERQKNLSAKRRKVTTAINKGMNAEKQRRFRKFAQEMEKLFLADPSCSNSEQIAALCSRYL